MNVCIDCFNRENIESEIHMSFSKKDSDSLIWCKFKCVFDYLNFLSNSIINIDRISVYITEGFKPLYTLKTSKGNFDKEQCDLLKIQIVKEFYKHNHEI